MALTPAEVRDLPLRTGAVAAEAGGLRLGNRLREQLPRLGYELWLKPSPRAERSGIVAFRHTTIVPEEVLARLLTAVPR